MFTVLMMILIIICILITIVILMQSSKGTGLSGAFGGASGMGTVFGVRRTADFLTRATWVLGITFVILCIVINLFFLPTGVSEESLIRKSAMENPTPMPQQTPAPTQPRGQQPQQQSPQQSPSVPAQSNPSK